MSCFRLLTAGVLALLLTSGRASASPSRAEALFQEALRLRARGDLQGACQRFEQSQALDASPGTLLNVADCREVEGRVATAWTTFLAAAALGEKQDRPDVVREATRRAALLEPTLARLTLHTSEVHGMEISWDGVAVPLSVLDQPLPVDPGRHLLRISAPGFEPRLVSVVVAPGPGRHDIVVPVLTRRSTASSAPKRKPGRRMPEPRHGGAGADLPLAFIAGGALLTTAGFLTQAFVADCNDLCGSQAEVEDLRTIAHVLWGAAGASVGVGLTIAILEPDRPARPATVSVATGCGASVCGALVGARF